MVPKRIFLRLKNAVFNMKETKKMIDIFFIKETWTIFKSKQNEYLGMLAEEKSLPPSANVKSSYITHINVKNHLN